MTGLRQMTLMLSLILIGSCAASGGGSPPPPPADPHGCPGSNPGITPINIKYNGSTIKAEPDKKEVHQGDVIRFNLVYTGTQHPEPEVLVSTAGKNPPSGWLNGSGEKKAGNPASTRFYICVPTDLVPDDEEEEEYQYSVNAVEHTELDPVVTVRH